jgi:hypothetical protein
MPRLFYTNFALHEPVAEQRVRVGHFTQLGGGNASIHRPNFPSPSLSY